MGSPIGLFGLVDKDGNPITRNYKVYNGGQKGTGQKVKSLFDNSSVFSPYPSSAVDPSSGTSLKIKKWADIHNDDIYNTSIASIVKYTSQNPGMRLDFMDFAYLRNVGVYPNNRLIVARRFGAAVGNDLTKMTVPPVKTMVSWIPETDDSFLSVTYNEVWDEAEASYTNVLNDLGKSFQMGGDNSTKVGDFLAGGIGLIPFPGLSEPIQRAVMKEFGLVDDPYNLPLGNPNLIRMAKKRYTVTPDEPGSGLACDIEIKMVVEYEQKFINGVDPTLAYMDILQNAIYFGTSDAAFQMGKAFGEGATGLLRDLISGNYSKIYSTLKKIITAIFKRLKDFITDLVDTIVGVFKEKDTDSTAEDQAEDEQDAARAENAAARNKLKSMLSKFLDISEKAVGAVVGKYKQRLLGITNALTGAPSTPWHITIGNPKKPVFCSGDMLLASVNMEMGKVLAYNDLPSTIKFTLTFRNARPLGAQEIFNRLNTGRGRTVISASIQTEANVKADGTIDQTGGPSKKKVVTKNFDASPASGENSKLSDYKYAYFEGSGEPYFTFDGEFEGGNVAQGQEPVNLAEAQRNDNGKVQSPAVGNQGGLAPSAGSGQQVYGPQPQSASAEQLGPPVPTQNTPVQAPTKKASRPSKKGRAKSNAASPSGSSPLSQSQINTAPNSQLQNRSNTLKDENGALSLQKRALDQKPKNETSAQRDQRLKKKAEVEKKILANSKEEDAIKKQLAKNQSQVGPVATVQNTQTNPGIPGLSFG